jgi:DNA-binding transcriptional LysR family regulator
VDWAEAATVPLCLLTPDMQNRRILDANFAAAGTVASPTVETNSISTLCSHVRRGWSSVMAHAWLSLFGVPEGMRAVPLVAPEVTHAIGIVVPEMEPLPPLGAALVELSLRLDLEGELDRLVAGGRRPSKR